MLAFVITGVLLAVVALAAVLRPLWRSRPSIGAALIASLACTSALLYWLVGTPRALDPAQREQPRTLAEAITRMEAELQRDPRQVEGWRLLARAYMAEGRADAARDALARAVELAPEDPGLLTEAAQARAFATDSRRFDAEAVALLQRALAIDPQHQRARWFLGIAQRQAGDAAQAAETWRPLLQLVDVDTARSLLEQINLARGEAGLPPLPDSALPAPEAGIAVSVSVDPELAARYPQGAWLFVIARQPGGPPMPVAVEKLQPAAYPVTVTLDDGDSPMPTLGLSQLEQVEISARVSASGQAAAQAGDFESDTVTVEIEAGASAALVIDRVVE
jgi:cytochrome c-type biogenesis protein CcmH